MDKAKGRFAVCEHGYYFLLVQVDQQNNSTYIETHLFAKLLGLLRLGHSAPISQKDIWDLVPGS
jgi:hypothetical protein